MAQLKDGTTIGGVDIKKEVDSKAKIVISEEQPENLADGVFWYKIISKDNE